MIVWCIISTNERDDDGSPLYWSNQDGWGPLETADAFSDDEHGRLHLPIGGEWREVATWQ